MGELQVPPTTTMTTDKLPVVECTSPNPRVRGRAHGEALRAVISAKVERWHGAVETEYGRKPEVYLSEFLTKTHFRRTIEQFTPHLLQEVIGIGEGADIDPDTAFALQLMDEEWWFGRLSRDGHCSGIAASPSGGRPTVMGQTMDLPVWHDGAQAVLRLRDADGCESLVFTSAGMIGLMGGNCRGLSVCVNTLIALQSSIHGLPVAFVVRMLLDQPSTREAVHSLNRVPHASGQNYMVADAHTVRAFECSAAGVAEVEAIKGRILHTNHPLASLDVRPFHVPTENSRARLGSIETDCPTSLSASAASLMSALSGRRENAEVSITRPANASPTSVMTIGGIVYEISDSIRLWVSGGPPTQDSWREFDIRAN